MSYTFRARIALMMITIMMVIICISSTFTVNAISEMDMETADQADETEGSADWFGVFCCIIVMLVTVGFPIAIIVFITKLIQGSSKKKTEDPKWKNYGYQNKRTQPSQPIRIDISHKQDPLRPDPAEQKKKMEIRRAIESEAYGLKKRKVPEVEEEIIEMDLTAMELEEEPEMPKFERPQALGDEEKDEFIVDRIMELQGMLRDGEIDEKMYDQLKKRLMDQLEG